jgi:hypothetical protein
METKPEKQPFGSNKHIYVLDAEKSNLTSTSYVPQPKLNLLIHWQHPTIA